MSRFFDAPRWYSITRSRISVIAEPVGHSFENAVNQRIFGKTEEAGGAPFALCGIAAGLSP
jgi:hypothetical protein